MTVASMLAVQVLQENLQTALGITGRIGNRPHNLPIVNNTLIQTDRGRLKLAATDLDTYIEVWLGARIDSEGATTAPTRTLADLVSSFPPATLQFTLRERKLVLEGARREATIATMEAEDFPVCPTVSGESIEIPARMLARALDHTIFAAATDDSRPVLQAVVWGEGLRSADGFRLSHYPLEGAGTHIIPRKAADALRRICEKSTENVTVTFGERAARFELTDMAITTTLVQGTFPNIGVYLEMPALCSVTVDAPALKSALRTVATVAREGNGQILLRASEGSLKLWTKQQDSVSDATVDATVEGEGDVALQVGYLNDALSVFEGPMVIELRKRSEPVTFRRAEDDGYRHVCMPLFVNAGEWE